MFEVNDVLRNNHTGGIVRVHDVVDVKGNAGNNPVFCVEYVGEHRVGFVDFRFNRHYTNHWELVVEEEE